MIDTIKLHRKLQRLLSQANKIQVFFEIKSSSNAI